MVVDWAFDRRWVKSGSSRLQRQGRRRMGRWDGGGRGSERNDRVGWVGGRESRCRLSWSVWAFGQRRWKSSLWRHPFRFERRECRSTGGRRIPVNHIGPRRHRHRVCACSWWSGFPARKTGWAEWGSTVVTVTSCCFPVGVDLSCGKRG